MKKALVVICMAMLVAPSFAQKKNKITEKGIKSITEIKEDYEKSNGKSTFESYIVYDKNGNVIEERSYDKNGKETEKIISEYDKDNQKVRETHYNPAGVKTQIEEYKYMDGLKTEKITYYGNGKMKSKKKYGYTYY
jgi:hypothetical protein